MRYIQLECNKSHSFLKNLLSTFDATPFLVRGGGCIPSLSMTYLTVAFNKGVILFDDIG